MTPFNTHLPLPLSLSTLQEFRRVQSRRRPGHSAFASTCWQEFTAGQERIPRHVATQPCLSMHDLVTGRVTSPMAQYQWSSIPISATNTHPHRASECLEPRAMIISSSPPPAILFPWRMARKGMRHPFTCWSRVPLQSSCCLL